MKQCDTLVKNHVNHNLSFSNVILFSIFLFRVLVAIYISISLIFVYNTNNGKSIISALNVLV